MCGCEVCRDGEEMSRQLNTVRDYTDRVAVRYTDRVAVRVSTLDALAGRDKRDFAAAFAVIGAQKCAAHKAWIIHNYITNYDYRKVKLLERFKRERKAIKEANEANDLICKASGHGKQPTDTLLGEFLGAMKKGWE